MNSIGRQDLIDAIVASAELSKDVAENVVEEILGAVTESLQRGEHVYIRSLGTFGVRTRKARVGLNPKTCEKVSVKPKTVAFFKPCNALKRQVAAQH